MTPESPLKQVTVESKQYVREKSPPQLGSQHSPTSVFFLYVARISSGE